MPPRRARVRDRGAIAVLAAVILTAMAGFLALVFNVAHFFSNRAKLQTAADAAAIAGAMSLDGTSAGMTQARSKALNFAAYHKVDGTPVTITASDVETGCWNLAASPTTKWGAFMPWGASACSDVRDVNAVRVRDAQDGEGGRNAEMAVLFGAFLNVASVKVRREAVAVGGGPCAGCAVPFVLAECQVLDGARNLNCNSRLTFANSNADSIGFTDFSSSSVSTNSIIQSVSGCATPPCCINATARNVRIANGNNLNCNVATALSQFVGQRIRIPVVDVPCSGNNPQFTGVHPIVGFAQATIHGVCGENGNGNGNGNGNQCNFVDGTNDPATRQPWACSGGRAILISVDCEWATTETRVGCASYGARADYAHLVR